MQLHSHSINWCLAEGETSFLNRKKIKQNAADTANIARISPTFLGELFGAVEWIDLAWVVHAER